MQFIELKQAFSTADQRFRTALPKKSPVNPTKTENKVPKINSVMSSSTVIVDYFENSSRHG